MKPSIIEAEFFWSVCCGAEIIMHDENGHGHCSECGDNTTPDNEIPEPKTPSMNIQTRRKLFNIGFYVAVFLTLLLFIISCNPYKELSGKPCKSLYSMPVSSPFFTVSYNRETKQIYILTDLRLGNNKSHFLQHHDTCEKIQVSSIEKKGDLLKMTFQLSEEQFSCYDSNLNESDITYCTRNNQEF